MLLKARNSGSRLRPQDDERSDTLRALGAEIFEGDFLDVRSVKRAVQDVFIGLFMPNPVQDGLLDATRGHWPSRRAEAGISRLVTS